MKPGRFLPQFVAILILGLGLVATASAAEVQNYTVKQGDTLYSISEQFYGDRSLWPKLWEMNKKNMSNPHRLTIGDVLYLYPLDQVKAKRMFPPPPPKPAAETHYDRGRALDTEFPKYFTYVADPRGIAKTGVNRIKVKKTDPLTRKTVITYDEVREVGEVIASEESGYVPDNADLRSRDDFHGRLMLSFHDNVIVRFTEDVGQILDSETHEDADPFFREYPIYGFAKNIREPDNNRIDHKRKLGALHQFKGVLTIVSRIEGMQPINSHQEQKLAKSDKPNQDSEPVSYVAKITYSERTVRIGDKIFLFKSLYPGPDRDTGRGRLHSTGQHNPVLP